MRRKPAVLPVAFAAVLLLSAGAGCASRDDDGGGADGTLRGRIDIDGSSTVEPFTAAAADRFQSENPDVAIVVGISPSRTGEGFGRFCAGETDLANASRPITDEEIELCEQGGVEYVELQVANDALTVVVNEDNDWATCLTTDELKNLWAPGSKVDSWNQIRAGFPDEELQLFGPGSDSGTFDYFTATIVGEAGASRTDYTASEDDDEIVQRVADAMGGLGYLGLSYFRENQDRLKALEIDSGMGCVAPSVETAKSGEYTPLSRPLFIYANEEALQQPTVRAFTQHVLDNAVSLAEEALLVPVTEAQLQREQAELDGL